MNRHRLILDRRRYPKVSEIQPGYSMRSTLFRRFWDLLTSLRPPYSGGLPSTHSAARLAGRTTSSGALLSLCVVLSGCISTERPLLPNVGADIALPNSPLVTACDDSNHCQYGFIQKTGVAGISRGGPIDGNRDFRNISLHKLDADHHIVQFLQPARSGGTHQQYVLVRARESEGKIFVYSPDLTKFNPKYLEEFALEGGLVDATLDVHRRLGMRTWKVTTREGLVRLFKNLSAMPHAELAKLGNAVQLANMSKAQLTSYVYSRAKNSSEVEIEQKTTSSAITVTRPPASSAGPAVLPSGVMCKEIAKPSQDIHPQLEQEVIFFSKYGCGHCRNIEGYVGTWQIASPEVNFYNSTVIDWKEPTVEMYDVERVPSFVVNRRFMVSLDTSDKKTVEYALGLISSLARGR